MKISVVSTLYKSRIYLPRFLEEIRNTLSAIGCDDYELIFVNDGSPDDSLEYLLERKKDCPQIKAIDLSRNFGHHYAIQAGLTYAAGDLIFLIDNDLETPPAVLKTFYNEMQADAALDVVYGYQESRKGNFIEKFSGKLFWVMINRLSDTKVPHNILTERLMTKQYVAELLRLQDASLFLGGMMHWVGFHQKGVAVKKGLREGASTYSVSRRIALMIQAVTSFSGKPLEWLFYFGLSISGFSFVFIIWLVIQKIIHGDEIQLGWASIISINMLILGIVSTFLGLIGIYIYKIFRQVQGRPNAIIRKIYE